MDYWNLSLQQKADFVLKQLKEDYPSVETPLIHKNEFELLVAVVLSPQTKDETTNKVTPTLFEKYPDVYSLAKAKPSEIEPIIRLVNYHKTKAKRLVGLANMLIEEFEGKVPHTLEDLIKLPGVGRKVANVVINEWFVYLAEIEDKEFLEKAKKEGLNYHPEGFVVDTHVLRISKALGLTEYSDPVKVEQDLMKLFHPSEWRAMSLRMIFHGREYMQAKKPQYEKHDIWKNIYGGN